MKFEIVSHDASTGFWDNIKHTLVVLVFEYFIFYTFWVIPEGFCGDVCAWKEVKAVVGLELFLSSINYH